MMPSNARDIPDSIRTQMVEFRRRLRWSKFLELLCVLGIVPLACLLIFFVSDRFWDTPFVLRWLLLAPSILAWLVLPIWCWFRWVHSKRTPRQLGRFLLGFDQSLGDQILSLFDLDSTSAQQGMLSATSPALRKAAIAQIASELQGRDFMEVLPASRRPQLLKILLSLAGVLVLCAIILPHATGNALLRWFTPSSERERFTFVKVAPLPKRLVIPKGESTEFTVTVLEGSKYLPEVTSYHLGNQPARTVPRTDHHFTLTIPALNKDETLHVRTGDYTRSIRLTPRSRPELASAYAKVELPSYLKRSATEEMMRSGTIAVMEGSTISVHATSTRELAHAEMGEGSSESTSITPKVSGTTMNITNVSVGKDPIEWAIKWQDVDGLTSSQPIHIAIAPFPDKKPEVAVRAGASNKYILADTAIPLEIEASDDFGIAEVGLVWSGEGVPDSNAPAGAQPPASPTPQATSSPEGEIPIHTGHATELTCRDTYIFRANDLGIAPQRVVVQAYAKDFCPDREPVYSEPLVLHVLSPENHAEMIRHSIDRLAGSLEEVSRSLDSMEDEIKALSQQSPEDLRNANVTAKLQNLEQDEVTQRRNLQELVDQGETIFTEATRNTQLDPEGMKRFMEGLQMLTSLPKGALRQAQKKIEEAGTQELNPEQRKESLAEADREHSRSANQVRQAIAKFSKATKDMEAGTFVARLSHLSDMELSIAKALIEPLQSAPGLNLSALPPSVKRNLDTIRALQESTTKDMRWFIEDLGHYKSRNANPIYSDLFEQMSEADPAQKMEGIRNFIGQAYSGTAMEHAHRMAILLDNWSKLLADEKKKAPEGGGGEGGDASPEDIPQSVFELMLKLMRMIQQQQDIRMRTRAEEQIFRKEATSR